MDQIIKFFKGLFETNHWPARWNCGYWSSFHGWLYIASELMIWAAYFFIPLIILHFISKKKSGLKFQKVYILFAAFILLCGTTHFIDALMFYHPFYRFNALVRFVTGVISLFTVYHLFRILPTMFSQKTNFELEAEIEKRLEVERKLTEANKGLQAFAYVASHDLQEPLRKIRTFSNLLTNANAGYYDSKSLEYSNKIINSAERMQQLITDVLGLSALDHQAEMAPTDVQTVIVKAIDDLEIKINEKNAIINHTPIPFVLGNEAYLAQLFSNLISNSIKFSTQQPIIKISGEQVDDNVIITVSDNGIGMEHQETEKIFEAFKRLNSKSQFEGSGIGLAICKKIIDIHNGRITVMSTPGEGTTFTIVLKAVPTT